MSGRCREWPTRAELKKWNKSANNREGKASVIKEAKVLQEKESCGLNGMSCFQMY
jgi:hypothetical protein